MMVLLEKPKQPNQEELRAHLSGFHSPLSVVFVDRTLIAKVEGD